MEGVMCKDCLVMMVGSIEVAQTYLAFQNSQGTIKPHEW